MIRRTCTAARFAVLLVAAAGVSLVSSARAQQPAAANAAVTIQKTRATGIPWQRDLHAAREISLETNKPMLLVFGAGWCKYCRKLDEQTLSDAQVSATVEEHFVPVLLDYDVDRELAAKLEIKSLPCSIVLSPDADLLGRLVGFVEAAKFRDALLASQRLQERVQQVRYEMGK